MWLSNDVLSNHYATSVYHDGRLYGFHGRQEFGPVFRAVDMQTGKVLWSTERFGAGRVTLAGDRLLIVRETGELMLAAASPAGIPADRRGADSCRRPCARIRRLPTGCSMCATTTRWWRGSAK